MRVATDSRIECDAVDEICERAPRDRSSAASGASRRGGLSASCPGAWFRKRSIQLTDCIRMNTCQKQVRTPKKNTPRMKPFSARLVPRMPSTVSRMNHPPALVSAMVISIETIWRIGWLKLMVGSAGGLAMSLSLLLG